MKKTVTLIVVSILLGVETLAVGLFAGVYMLFLRPDNEITERHREISPDGTYTLVISQIGDPDWPYGQCRLSVSLTGGTMGEDTYVSTGFRTTIADDGSTGWFEVEWMPEGVQITLSGSEQADAVYILPFPSPSEFHEAGTDIRETGNI